eukprot:COSAG04_NODE_22417_length_355_cov_0.812500_1_plen_30_part_10
MTTLPLRRLAALVGHTRPCAAAGGTGGPAD